MRSEIQKQVDAAWEAYLVEQFPDPKRRALARWILNARAKAISHKLITGRDPTDAELQAFLAG